MGNKLLSYQDAATLLGAQSPVLAKLSKLAGAALTVASAGGSSTALSLFDLKGEVERLGQDTVVTLRNRVMGLYRFKRSELLEAAHAVLVVTAFFAALDDLDQQLGAALNSASLDLNRAEQTGLATGFSPRTGSAGLAELAGQLIAPNVIPGLGGGWADRGSALTAFYADLAERVSRFAAGTAVWDQRDETTRDRWSATVTKELPQCALARYEQQLGQLAGEFPEFAFWAHRVGVQTVLDQLSALRRTLAELTRPSHRPEVPSSRDCALGWHGRTRASGGGTAATVGNQRRGDTADGHSSGLRRPDPANSHGARLSRPLFGRPVPGKVDNRRSVPRELVLFCTTEWPLPFVDPSVSWGKFLTGFQESAFRSRFVTATTATLAATRSANFSLVSQWSSSTSNTTT